jgi:hypothetical protein
MHAFSLAALRKRPPGVVVVVVATIASLDLEGRLRLRNSLQHQDHGALIEEALRFVWGGNLCLPAFALLFSMSIKNTHHCYF